MTRALRLTTILIATLVMFNETRSVFSEETIAAPMKLEQARRQAEVLHTAVHATLQAVHHRYYREDEGLPIPAAMLKKVFSDIEKEQQITIRWLAVEGQAMNTDHEAKDDFEKKAVQAIKSGQGSFEFVENQVYRRAGTIVLGNNCLKCHVPDRKSTAERKAGLVISLKLQK